MKHRKTSFQSRLGLLAIGLSTLVAGAGCSAEVSDAPSADTTTATASQTLTKSVDVQGRTILVDVDFTSAVSNTQAQALLDAIQVFTKDTDPEFDGAGVYGYSEVSADSSRDLTASVPALAIHLHAQDPSGTVDDLAWSWPADAFPPSNEQGVVLAADALGTENPSDVSNIYAGAAYPDLAPAASVKSKWTWFGTKFYVELSKKEACDVALSGKGAGAVIEALVTQPYGTLVAIGIELQVAAIERNVGKDGVELRVFGPVSPTPGIIYKVVRRGSSTSC